MLYRFITSGYTDALAYSSAFVTALWIFVARQYASELPGFLASVSPLYGLALSAFAGALLICKYVCFDGHAETINRFKADQYRMETMVRSRDQAAVELTKEAAERTAEISALRSKIVTMEENSPTNQLREMRRQLRTAEDDKKSALTVLVKNLQTRLAILRDIQDDQLRFAADVLRQEVELIENELKRGERTYYELCLKIVDISDNLSELNDIDLAATLGQTAHQGSVAETWLNFIRVNDNSDPAAVERSFKFFKVAFHPDRFSSESLKVEATKYFQHSINAHNSVKRRDKAAL
jgi:hypothetical protein